jgi:hypothetical protein
VHQAAVEEHGLREAGEGRKDVRQWRSKLDLDGDRLCEHRCTSSRADAGSPPVFR